MNQSKRISTLLVGLLAILLIVLATSVVASAGEPAEKTDAAFLAANPELMFARRYTAEMAKRADVAAVEKGTEAAFLVANPEMMFARRYIAEAAERAAAFSACYEGHH